MEDINELQKRINWEIEAINTDFDLLKGFLLRTVKAHGEFNFEDYNMTLDSGYISSLFVKYERLYVNNNDGYGYISDMLLDYLPINDIMTIAEVVLKILKEEE